MTRKSGPRFDKTLGRHSLSSFRLRDCGGLQTRVI